MGSHNHLNSEWLRLFPFHGKLGYFAGLFFGSVLVFCNLVCQAPALRESRFEKAVRSTDLRDFAATRLRAIHFEMPYFPPQNIYNDS